MALGRFSATAANTWIPYPHLTSPPHLATTEGLKAEAAFAKDGTLPNPDSTDNAEFKIVLGLIRDTIKKDATKWTR